MSKKRFELLNDAQWELVEPLLPERKRGTLAVLTLS
jgi:transposase